jgi:type III restriction enzyme
VKVKLKEFQEEVVNKLVSQLRLAQNEVSASAQAIILSAPTGSGKTMMATAAIERIIEGDGSYAANREATFLWLSDRPELNEQTRRKMLETSSVLDSSRLTIIESTFDQEVFSTEHVYFLNIQKLGKEKQLVTAGDGRTYTLWETTTRTVNAKPNHFFVFIDEAHRGMAITQRELREANSIIQKFIIGSPGEVPPIPLIAGISATPERFQRLVQETDNRTYRSVNVSPEEVRASGLLKDMVRLYHPEKPQATDITMLSAAGKTWQTFVTKWAEYCESQKEAVVKPILLVQVEDGSQKQVSKTDLGQVIDVLNEASGPLPTITLAHAFQEGSQIDFGAHKIRYIAPSDITIDSEVRVVFFKTSLNTGWDCPRAEVMMSFRKAVDSTLIAQLVGRMVRTPLARRISGNEFLNSVALYLPHYDEGGLRKVIERLTTPDPDILPPVDIERGEDILTLTRSKGSDQAFSALSSLPSYIIPRPRKVTGVRRLMKLARLLANDELLPTAVEEAYGKLLEVLQAEYKKIKDTKQFRDIVQSRSKVKIRAVDWQMGGRIASTETIELDIAKENLDDLFEIAGRKMGEGLHKAWWRERVTKDESLRSTAKLEVIALCLSTDVLPALERAGQDIVRKWLEQDRQSINNLPEAEQEGYNEVRQLAAEPEIISIAYPGTIEMRKGDTSFEKHLYVDEKGLFSTKLNDWETQVITEELKDPSLSGWLRNLDRRPWSLTIPYQEPGGLHAFYPDFLVVRSAKTGPIVDIIEPHQLDLADAPAKARGMARYAAQHGPKFGRIQLVIVKDGQVKRLDLTKEEIRKKVEIVESREHLRRLFESNS